MSGSPVAEPEARYDEEQWKSSFAEADEAPVAGDEHQPLEIPEMENEPDNTPVPSLAELLEKVPARNQELLESLFRGRFVDVQRLNRKKLF